MKRYIIILISLVAASMAACNSDDFLDDYNALFDTDNAITFLSSVELTKAQETDITALQEYGKFVVNAYVEGDESLLYYFGTDVNYDDGVWGSTDNYYWPVTGALTFYAYSPTQDNVVLDDETKDIIEYSCPSDIDEQIDLLVKTLTNQTYKGTSVDMEFQHALSSIEFKIKFQDEKNITLNNISINYIGIENIREYSFVDEAWTVPETKSYFTSESGFTTAINVDENKTTTDADTDPITFDEIDNWLMIIPQPISFTETDPHYISVQISYSLESADGVVSLVETGVMPLPAPTVNSTTQNEYKKGELYTYTLVVNGEQIIFESVEIEDQEEPVSAYGNIDLGLITTYMTASEIGYGDQTDETDAQFYYTTALRVKNLLADGVRDFVVVGSMGASSDTGENTLGDGKLGYYGSTSSPFYIGAMLAGLDSSNENDYFSIDLRGTYDYPRFADANSDTGYDSDDTSETTVSTSSNSSTIDDDEPILIAGLFAEIDYLDEVILPYGIAAIGNHAFADCSALRHIDLAEVEHIEIGAFQDCSKLELVDNGALTRVHEHGFDKCYSLTTIDLSSVVEIDDYGFVDCTSLTDVDLSNLDDIGQHAFNGCINLTLKTGTEIPGFTMVEDYAFSKCTRLGENGSKIHLEDATKVGDHAFAECEHIQLSSGELNVLTEVGTYAFSGCTALGTNQEFSIPNLASVDMAGFADCPELNIISGLENLDIISYYAFQNCTSLTGYSSTATDKTLYLSNVTEVEGYGLTATAITNVSFSDKLTTIGEHAFNSCSDLVTLTGLDKVTSVDKFAFANCSSLEELNLPLLTNDNNNLCSFFTGCTSLKTISMPLLTTNDVSWWDGDSEVYYSSSITGMINTEFTAIETIDLQSLVVDVPGWHFSDKTSLKDVNFASATSIESGAFAGCSALETIDFTAAESIGSYALQGCESLEELSLPNAETWGEYFLSGCTSITRISLPSVTDSSITIENEDGTSSEVSIANSFSDCTKLEELILSSVEGTISGWGYFTNNPNLKYVDLSSVDEVDSGIFDGCENLISIDLSGATSVIGQNVFDSCSKLVKLNLSGLMNDAVFNSGIFWGFANSANCELWLSDEQYANNVSNGNTWQGMTWKAIHSVASGEEFTLK
ncbi:MAG: leucine-rich repeat protein [Rikenellaceae bacterium]